METQKKLLDLLSDTVNKTKNYLNIFDVTYSYSFSVSNDKKEDIKESFLLLSNFLLSASEVADSLTAQISALLCNADENMNNELTAHFSKILENYFSWRKALLNFLDNSANIILNKNSEFKYSLLFSYAQSFLSASESLIGILNTKQ